MQRRLVASSVAALLVGAACGSLGGDPKAEPTASTSGAATPSEHAEPSIERPAPVRLERLPPQGFVVGHPAGVEFVDVRGRIIDRLPGFHLYYEWTVPGPVILRSRRVYYLLDVEAHVLDPLESRDMAFDLAPQFQEGVDPIAESYLDLERPAHTPGTGFWAYALVSPDGSALLGQWSGECETPTAWFLSPDGANPVVIFGGPSLADAPNSRALGWTSDGIALAHLMQGACGGGASPGVYAARPGEQPELLLELGEPAAVRMWGTA
jgi:hypothetical protein